MICTISSSFDENETQNKSFALWDGPLTCSKGALFGFGKAKPNDSRQIDC